MIKPGQTVCPKCGGILKKYDKVKRVVRTKERDSSYIKLQRFKCTNCGSVHREIPENVIPYKQYEAELIRGVQEQLITSDTLGYEDYPCEMTMMRWKTLIKMRDKNNSSYGKTI